MKRMRLLVLIVLLLGLSALVVPLGCKDAADTSPSSTLSTPLSNTGGRPLATLPSVSPDEPGTGLGQRQRFVAVWNLANGGYAMIRYGSLPSPDWSAELIVYGRVVKVDPPLWNTADGRQPDHDQWSEEYAPEIYTTFYVQLTEIKGTPRFGTPVAIMVTNHDKLLAEGDEVLVFAEYAGDRRYGIWKQDAYFSIEGVRGIYMKVGEQYLNIVLGQPCQSP